MPKSDLVNGIEKIIEETIEIDHWGSDESYGCDYNISERSVKYAAQAIKELMLEKVGEDKERIDRDVPMMFAGADNTENLKISGYNQAKAEIRKRLEEM